MILIMILLTGFSMADELKPSTKIRCTAERGEYARFDFDLYPTGHPMGGVGMFTGMFRGERMDGGVDIGHIKTRPGLLFVGESGSQVFQRGYELSVPTDFFHEGVTYESKLRYREMIPFVQDWKTQTIQCREVP